MHEGVEALASYLFPKLETDNIKKVCINHVKTEVQTSDQHHQYQHSVIQMKLKMYKLKLSKSLFELTLY